MVRRQFKPVSIVSFAVLTLVLSPGLAGCGAPQGVSIVAATPVISPAGGSFSTTQTITITDATPGVSIFYTSNGASPTSTSTLYTGPIQVVATETIQAIATGGGHTPSDVASATFSIATTLVQAAAPAISPASGTFTTAQTIMLTDATPGATIFYTLDGSTPTTSSTPYTAPFLLGASATISAIATASGYTASPTATATYTLSLPSPPTATPAISPAGGSFTTAQTVALTDATPNATIYYTLDGSTPDTTSTRYIAPLSVTQSETVQAVALAPGYALSPTATAAFTLTLPTPAPVISPSGGTFTSSQNVTLTDVAQAATIYYTTDGTAPTTASQVYSAPITLTESTTLKAAATASGHSISPVASGTFTLTGSTAAPVISPNAGSFTSSLTVTLTDPTLAATIFYTLDGTIPTSSSTVYTAPITLKKTQTVKAVAQLTGFTLSPVASTSFVLVTSGTGISGTVSFNKHALQNASVSVYAAGQTGYGSAATLISPEPALSDAFGSFTVQYTCPSSSSLVYLLSTAGQLASTNQGSGLVLVTLLGSCNSLNPANDNVINEFTTVAAAWSLAPFVQILNGSGSAQIGSASTNTAGLGNAFLTAQNLVDNAHGTVRGPSLPAGATLPTAVINTLADVLASYATSPPALFQAAVPQNGTPPADTFAAAADIAQNPARNVSGLFALINPSSPFQPSLPTAPNDWTLAIRYTGGGLDGPTSLAVDQGGAIWVANYFGSVSKFTPQGSPISPSTGYTGGGLEESFGLAVDAAGSVWITNQQSPGFVNTGNGSVTKMSSSGTVLSGTTGYPDGGLNYPEAIAIDSGGNAWIANYGNSTATLLSASGAAISPSTGYGSGQMVFPVAVALDAQDEAWFGNQGGSTITSISAAGTSATEITCCQGASGIAIDQQGNLWTANYYGNSVSQITSTGKVVSAGYAGGGLAGPRGIAVDGAQTIWVTNYQGNSITQLQGANSSAPGMATALATAAGLSLPYALAVDASGSVWVSSSGNDALIELVGVASPVKTPLLGLPQQP